MVIKVVKRYKEILFGALLGAAMWVTDAAMHAQLGVEIHSHGFWAELFQPHPTTLLFRSVYFLLALAFGVFLWRVNWRERQLRALEDAIISFQRQLDSPALRIITHIRQLQTRNSVKLDEIAAELSAQVEMDAVLIDELARRYLAFSQQVQAGQTTEAVKTLQTIENWLIERK